jgi:hypothetical protein
VVSSSRRALFDQVVAHPTKGDAASDEDVSPGARPNGLLELQQVRATARDRWRERALDELTEGLEPQRPGSRTEREDVHAAEARLGHEGGAEELRSFPLDELDQIAGVIGQLGEVTVHLGVLDA